LFTAWLLGLLRIRLGLGSLIGIALRARFWSLLAF